MPSVFPVMVGLKDVIEKYTHVATNSANIWKFVGSTTQILKKSRFDLHVSRRRKYFTYVK